MCLWSDCHKPWVLKGEIPKIQSETYSSNDNNNQNQISTLKDVYILYALSYYNSQQAFKIYTKEIYITLPIYRNAKIQNTMRPLPNPSRETEPDGGPRRRRFDNEPHSEGSFGRPPTD